METSKGTGENGCPKKDPGAYSPRRSRSDLPSTAAELVISIAHYNDEHKVNTGQFIVEDTSATTASPRGQQRSLAARLR
jgi:hypothetical protein